MTGFGLLYNLLGREGKMQVSLLQAMIKECNILISLAVQEGEKDKIKQYTELLESIEDALQVAWGFTANRSKHIHWLNNVDCKCPKLDNQELWGIDRIITEDCPVHNYKFKEAEEAEIEKKLDKPVKVKKTRKKTAKK